MKKLNPVKTLRAVVTFIAIAVPMFYTYEWYDRQTPETTLLFGGYSWILNLAMSVLVAGGIALSLYNYGVKKKEKKNNLKQ